MDGVALEAAFELAKRAGLPAQSAPKTKLLHLCGPVPGWLDPALHIHHAMTWYLLQPVRVPHRLLGTPISSDTLQCAQAAFATLPGAMRAASARRRLLRLNAFGRSHMAMQCISAKAVFHAMPTSRTPNPSAFQPCSGRSTTSRQPSLGLGRRLQCQAPCTPSLL